MPKEIKDVKEFLKKIMITQQIKKSSDEKTKRPESAFEKSLIVKHNPTEIKFKLRTRKCLYTFKTSNKDIAQKLLKNLPNSLKKTEIKKSSKKIRK